MARTATALVLLAALACAQEAPAPKQVQVEGRVVDLQGKPIAGASVYARHTGEAWDGTVTLRAADAQADRDGHYVLTLPEQQHCLLRVTARGFCTAQHQPVLRATTEQQQNTRVPTIALPPAVKLTGRVRSPEGKAIAGARVTARDLAPSALRLSDCAIADDQGIFQLTAIPASPVELRVEAKGRAPVRLLPIDRSSPLDVRMEAMGSCTGTLLAADGKPTAGSVFLAYEDAESATAKTDADGHFRFDLRTGLRYRLRCVDPAQTVSAYSDVFAADQQGIELRQPGGPESTFLEVQARSEATGEVVPEFAVIVDWQNSDPKDHGQVYLSSYVLGRGDKDGLARIPVNPAWQPGQGLALVRAPGHAEQIVALPAKLDSGVMHLAVTMPGERVIRGKVVDADGQPVAGATIWPFTRKTRISSYSGLPQNATKSGPDGSFACPGLAAADYVLNVMHLAHPDAAPLAVSLKDGDANDVKLTLAMAQRLDVKWTNPPTGGDWCLDLEARSDGGGRRGEALPYGMNRSGRTRVPVSFAAPLELPRVAAARVELTMRRLTLERLAREVEVSFGEQRLDGPTTCTLDLDKLATGTITGRVKTTELAALDHLMVRSGGRWPPGAASLVERDGSFRLEVQPGTHTLEVVDLLAGYALGRSEPLRVGAGDKVECELQVEAGILDVTIGLPEGVTRSAMHFLLLERGQTNNGQRDLKQIELTDLRGGIRLVLPPGEMKLGFQRAGALGTGGGWMFVDIGVVSVDVPSGKVQPFVLAEPPRMTAAELASERSLK